MCNTMRVCKCTKQCLWSEDIFCLWSAQLLGWAAACSAWIKMQCVDHCWVPVWWPASMGLAHHWIDRGWGKCFGGYIYMLLTPVQTSKHRDIPKLFYGFQWKISSQWHSWEDFSLPQVSLVVHNQTVKHWYISKMSLRKWLHTNTLDWSLRSEDLAICGRRKKKEATSAKIQTSAENLRKKMTAHTVWTLSLLKSNLLKQQGDSCYALKMSPKLKDITWRLTLQECKREHNVSTVTVGNHCYHLRLKLKSQ